MYKCALREKATPTLWGISCALQENNQGKENGIMSDFKPNETTETTPLYMYDLLQTANDTQHTRLWIALFLMFIINALAVFKAWKK